MDSQNYCRQIARQIGKGPTLNRSYKTLIPQELIDKSKSANLIAISALTADAKKFILPDNGVLINDAELRGLESIELRLPYPIVALEFNADRFGQHIDQTLVVAVDSKDSDDILIYTASRLTPNLFAPNGLWFPVDSSGLFPIKIPKCIMSFFGDGKERVNYLSVFSIDKNPVPGCVFGFLNALACSNVYIGKAQRAKAKTKKALSFDEYHILELKQSGGLKGESQNGAVQRSPREHLRRGHIRRLHRGERIWVNSHVVAANRGAGKITKDYLMKGTTA